MLELEFVLYTFSLKTLGILIAILGFTFRQNLNILWYNINVTI